MSAAIDSWDIDDWLQSLGIDPDCDVVLGQMGDTWRVGDTWTLEVRVPAGEDADEYLCGLEAAWIERFGGAPVEFRAHQPRTFASMLAATLAGVDKEDPFWTTSIAPGATVKRPRFTSYEPLTAAALAEAIALADLRAITHR